MLIENLKMALSSLIANKMRSLLTMLGMIIGIGSVILTTSLGDTLRKAFSDIFANLGVSQAFIYVHMKEPGANDWFSLDDLASYREVFPEKLVYLDGYDRADCDIRTKSGDANVTLNGVDSPYASLQPSLKLIHGRFLNEKDVREEKFCCVIEDRTALSLFGTEDAVGRSFRTKFLNDIQEFSIVGVYHLEMPVFQQLILGVGKGPERDAYVPWSLFKARQTEMYMFRFFVSPKLSPSELETFQHQFFSYVVRQKGRTEADYGLESAELQRRQADQFLSVLSLIVACIAGISLLVGGIGIMNIMLVSVTERTREIGTRKALGATTGDIMLQFLIESAVLSACGGIIGILLAVGLAGLGGLLLHQAIVIRIPVILLAVGFSALVGIFFGIYPAKKAATCDPIVALRYE